MLKEASFISLMILLVFLVTLVWNWIEGTQECLSGSNVTRSIKYTMFISLILVIFYLTFEWAWKQNALATCSK